MAKRSEELRVFYIAYPSYFKLGFAFMPERRFFSNGHSSEIHHKKEGYALTFGWSLSGLWSAMPSISEAESLRGKNDSKRYTRRQ